MPVLTVSSPHKGKKHNHALVVNSADLLACSYDPDKRALCNDKAPPAGWHETKGEPTCPRCLERLKGYVQ